MRIFTLLFLLIYANNVDAQNKRVVRKEYGIINQIDTIDFDLSLSNISYVGYKYLFNIFHLQVVTALKDTVPMAVVYNINKDLDSLLVFKNFIGKPFIFTICEFTPSTSDFPHMANCSYETGLFSPDSNSFLYNKPYKSIQRVIDLVAMDPALWQELRKLYN